MEDTYTEKNLENIASDDMLPTKDEIVREISARELIVDRRNKMQRLLENDDFMDLFQKHFIEDFAVSNAMTFGSASPQERARVLEKMASRGHFSDFCDSLISQGNQAEYEISELNSMKTRD